MPGAIAVSKGHVDHDEGPGAVDSEGAVAMASGRSAPVASLPQSGDSSDVFVVLDPTRCESAGLELVSSKPGDRQRFAQNPSWTC